MPDARPDPVIVQMISDFIRNGNFRLNWDKYGKIDLSRRRIQRYRRRAMEVYSYFPSIEEKISDLKTEIEKKDLNIKELTLSLNSFRKSSEDAVKVADKFNKY